MMKSMTAFGRAKREFDSKSITFEIKSVNSRFFDCSVKMPRAYLFLEERIKAYVQKNAVSRAKVDVFITVDSHTSGIGSVSVDKAFDRGLCNNSLPHPHVALYIFVQYYQHHLY